MLLERTATPRTAIPPPRPLAPQIAPTGMIFIPCRGGWSHRPDEYASPQDIERGVKARRCPCRASQRILMRACLLHVARVG
jgi:hypothetical protein